MPRRIELTGEREAQYYDLQALRRRRLIDTQTYTESINELVRDQTKVNRRAATARLARETARLAREAAIQAARRAAEAIQDAARKERRRVAQQARRQRARVARLVISYPTLGRELIPMPIAEVTAGVINEWVSNIPLTRFQIRCEYGLRRKPTIKIIEKRNDSPNGTWWIEQGNFWKLLTDSEQTIFNKPRGIRASDIAASMSLVIPEAVRGAAPVQRLRTGKEHCIFGPLKAFFLAKIENIKGKQHQRQLSSYSKQCDDLAKKYDAGITIEELEKETATMNISIYIYRVDRKLKVILNPKKKWSFAFLNTTFNHCEVFLTDANAIELSPYDMKICYQDLLRTESPFSYESSHATIRNIEAVGKKYRVKTPYEDLFKEFDAHIQREYFGVDYVQERSLFDYILQSCKHNTHMSFQRVYRTDYGLVGKGLKEIDCKAGYTQFKQAPCYRGFLGCVWDRCDKGETGLPLTIDDIKKHIGIYTIRITFASPLLKKICYKIGETYTLTSPLIEYLVTSGDIKCDILYGVYGSKADFEFPQTFLQKYDEETGVLGDKGIPLYSLWTGMTASASDHRVIRRRIDYRLVQDMKEAGEELMWEYDDECYDLTKDKATNQWVRTLKSNVLDMESPPGCSVQYIPKAASTNCPQIFAFITDYMKMNMIFEMKNIPLQYLYAWKVDSIVYERKEGKDVEDFKFRPIFRTKPVKVDFKMSDYIFKPSPCPEPINRSIVDTMTLFAGGGGSGKSHYAATIRNMLYVAPMWSMCVDFKMKYNNKFVLTPYQALGTNGARAFFDTTSWRPGTMYCDEATMLEHSVYTMLTTMPAAKHVRMIFGGDVDDIGRPFQTTFKDMMDVSKLKRKNFDEDHRCEKGDPLIQLKKDVRKFMYENYGDTTKLISYVKELLKDRIISRERVIEMYDIEDWILTGTVESYKRWTELLADTGEKYIVTDHKSTDVYAALNGEDIALNGDIIYYDNGRCEMRHAFTIHSAQGKTIANNVFIDMERLDFDYCLLYTALSRAKKLDQIYLVY